MATIELRVQGVQAQRRRCDPALVAEHFCVRSSDEDDCSASNRYVSPLDARPEPPMAAGCRSPRRCRRTQSTLAGSPPGCRTAAPSTVALCDVSVIGGAPSRGSPLRPGLRWVSGTLVRRRRHGQVHRPRPTRERVVAYRGATGAHRRVGAVSYAVPRPAAEFGLKGPDGLRRGLPRWQRSGARRLRSLIGRAPINRPSSSGGHHARALRLPR